MEATRPQETRTIAARHARGLTLLEVLVAFTILILVAVPVTSVLRDAARGASVGERHARAISIARDSRASDAERSPGVSYQMTTSPSRSIARLV